ncbi:hypothetical protein [Bacillus gaemokensis]|uniref:hypothetical protein n=1 Tax=Bacillus gaemokensis TaxID=574375 RepID=UPI0006919B27|nr:hypothetical protein [Bacillus gaemokensis]KYG37469.1 hypothetical protein AZF08_23655 [Bacillus gaemokensis]
MHIDLAQEEAQTARSLYMLEIIGMVIAFFISLFSIRYVSDAFKINLANEYTSTMVSCSIFYVIVFVYPPARRYCIQIFSFMTFREKKHYFIIITSVIGLIVYLAILQTTLQGTQDSTNSAVTYVYPEKVEFIFYVIGSILFALLWEELFFRGILLMKLGEFFQSG